MSLRNPDVQKLQDRPLNLSDIPQQQLFHLFVDEDLVQKEKGWQAFEKREPGCLAALCKAAEYAFFHDRDNLEVSEDLIKNIHQRCSSNVSKLNSTDFTPGEYRRNFTGFQISDGWHWDAQNPLSEEALSDVLKVIARQKEDDYESEENLRRLRRDYEHVARSAKDKGEKKVAEDILRNEDHMAGQTGSGLSILSRESAKHFIIHTSSDPGENLYSEIEKEKLLAIKYRAPAPHIISAEMKRAISQYNREIKTATTNEEKIAAISDLIWEIEHIHPFRDCNIRTCVLLLNRLLRQQGLGLAFLSDPNKIDCMSKKEWRAEIQKGRQRATAIARMGDGRNLEQIPEENRDLFQRWSLKLFLTSQLEKATTSEEFLKALKKVIEEVKWPVSYWGTETKIQGVTKKIPAGIAEEYLSIQKAIESKKYDQSVAVVFEKLSERIQYNPGFMGLGKRDPLVLEYYQCLNTFKDRFIKKQEAQPRVEQRKD